MANEIKKVVLAYSGGLDTSIIIPWLKENYNKLRGYCRSGDVGQGTELDGLEEKALKTGASKLYIADLTDEMVDEVIIPSMMMGAKYEDYLLGTAFARPIIARRLVEIAIATLLTDRALLLIGEPGTAKSWLSEHLAAAITGDSTKVVQGTAGTTEDMIKYSWNYALLLSQGPAARLWCPPPSMWGWNGAF